MPVDVDTRAVAWLFYTSGTTGRPKGAMWSHRTIAVALMNYLADVYSTQPEDVVLHAAPLTHGSGVVALPSLARAAENVILDAPSFEPDAVFGLIERRKVTNVAFLAPTQIVRLLADFEPGRFDLSSLRLGTIGGADIPVELVRRVHDELPYLTLISGYGLTEGGTAAGTSPGDDVETIATTVGRPRPGFELRLVDKEGSEVTPGTSGEILLRSGSVMSHYLDDPDATALAISSDGWLRTGDLGVMTETGCLRIVGRVKDMFIVGGFNAYPAEIEGMLLRHDGVAQVAVVGMPDERMGEVGVAFVVPRTGADAGTLADDLVAWARDAMANYKVPRRVEVVDALPLNASGKVRKTELRAQFSAE